MDDQAALDKVHSDITGQGRTRTFTDDELAVLTTALFAVRPHLTKAEQAVVNDIIRDGWS
jgi:hypothetical protein